MQRATSGRRGAPARAALACAAAAGVLLAGALLAGCSSPAPASDTLPPIAATTTATTPTLPPLGPADLPMPAEARQQTADGAAAFTRYYIALVTRTGATLDSAPVRQFSRDCMVCDQVADGTDATRAKRETLRGSQLTITSAGAPTFDGSTAAVAFLADQAPYQFFDPSGQPVPGRRKPALKISGGVALAWDPSLVSWVTTSLTLSETQ